MRPVVVYVHGLWLSGREAFLLRSRLAKALDADTLAFSYPSVAGGIAENALSLARFLAAARAETLHLIGHSLGGLVILKMFELAAPTLPPGRVVLLGPPIGGSCVARRLADWPFGEKIMGRSVHEELLTARARRWTEPRDLGVIAGNLPLGLGRLVGTGGQPSDGTVLVEETRLDGIRDHVVLRVTHSGMLFSGAVAQQAGAFLSGGCFAR